MIQHFLEVDDATPGEIAVILGAARAPAAPVLTGEGVALVMGLPSARTRNATEMAVVDLGGHPVTMAAGELGIDSRETAEDVARTLAQYHRAICARIADHEILARMAAAMDAAPYAVPVVNLLSGDAHPVQALADLLTLGDAVGDAESAALRGRRIAWVGDANNVARSLALAAVAVGIQVHVATPKDYGFSPSERDRIERYADNAGLGGGLVELEDPHLAVEGVDAVCTDVWISMGQEAERAARLAAFGPFQVTERLFAGAAPNAVFLHCLPAHRGEEVDDTVLDGPRSRVWQQAAHRRSATRGLLGWLMKGD